MPPRWPARSAENSLSDVRMQISNAVDNAVQKVINSRETLAAYYRAIALDHEVLNSRQVDLKEGRRTSAACWRRRRISARPSWPPCPSH